MTGTGWSWEEGNVLLEAVGDEKWLAGRVKAEREARDWSQAELSKRLKDAGYPMHQSAISKIESPPKDGARSITIGEAIGFARVYEIPLGELLMPPQTVQMAAFLKELAQGPARLREFELARGRYESLRENVARRAHEDPDLEAMLKEHWGNLQDRFAKENLAVEDSFEVSFVVSVLNRLDELYQAEATDSPKSKRPRKAKS